MKFVTFSLLSLAVSGGAEIAGTKGFTCPDGETLVASCFQDIQTKLSVGDVWTQDIQCGKVNGCECVDSCSADCMGSITAIVVDTSDDFDVKFSGFATGTVSFKAGTQANPTYPLEDGTYEYDGRKAISHIDLCLGEKDTTPVPEPAPTPLTSEPTANPTDKPTEATCNCGVPSSPCMEMRCVEGSCIESPKPAGTSCGLLGGTTCYPESDQCDGNGQCVLGLAEEGTPCGDQPESPCMFASSCSLGKCVTGQMKPDNTPCGDEETECMEAHSCQSGQCVTDVFKSETTPCGDQTTSACHPLADHCDGAGKCQSMLLGKGSPCGNSESACMNGDSCSVDGQCISGTPKEDGLSCGDAGDECNAADVCSNGVCMTEVFMVSGTPCGDTHDSPCNKPDSCDGKGHCVPNLEAEGMICGQEETDCMYASKCDANGGCIPGGPKPQGTSCGDPTMSVCNGPDSCDGHGSCLPNLVLDGTDCGKLEDSCNLADKCMSGECVSTTKPDETPCGSEPVGPCDTNDVCQAGVCIDKVHDSSVVCRPAASDCDLPEMCTGSSKTCPLNVFKDAGSSCGSTTDSSCTKPDTCNGSGTCLDNHVPDGSPCGFEGSQCMFADSCSSGECSVGGPKDTNTKCGTISGICDVQDFCDGAGSCPDSVADDMVVCRPADGECDLPEKCDGIHKECPADSFKGVGSMCGPTGSELEYCELQDVCNGSGGCMDNGEDPIEYTFKCGTTNFLCGNEVDGTLCNDGAKDVVKASDDECAGMIAGMMDPDQDTYSVKCPNNRAISHYVIYDCHGTSGTKYEPGNESTCSGRRNLRADKTSSRFW